MFSHFLLGVLLGVLLGFVIVAVLTIAFIRRLEDIEEALGEIEAWEDE